MPHTGPAFCISILIFSRRLNWEVKTNRDGGERFTISLFADSMILEPISGGSNARYTVPPAITAS